MAIEQIVGARIRALRKRNGLTQEELAERAGMAPQTLSRAERGGVISIANIKRVATALDANPLELFVDPDQEIPASVEIRRVVDLMQKAAPAVQQAIRQHAEIATRLAGESASNRLAGESASNVSKTSAGGSR